MEYLRKLRVPNSLKVIEFKYPTQNLNKYDDLTSEFSELSSINSRITGMSGGTTSTQDTQSTGISSYKNLNSYFNQSNN